MHYFPLTLLSNILLCLMFLSSEQSSTSYNNSAETTAMIKFLHCLFFYLAIGNITNGESMREKIVPDLKMVKHLADTTGIRMKRDEVSAEVECADDIKTKGAESIKCSEE